MLDKANRPIIIWLFSGCFLIYAMVLIGGITRLTHSGLSMVEWNMIVGSLPPINDADWQEPFLKYQQTPEYQQINNHFTLKEFKSIYWWEYTHRLLGRTIGIVFLLPFSYFLIRKKLNAVLIRNLLVVLVLGGFQGFLGWYMVKSGLTKEPHVSHYRLAAHLISALTVFGFTFWVALDLLFPKGKYQGKKLSGIKPYLYILFIVVIIQIIYGAFVAGLKAGLFYTTFPKMNDQWIANEVIALTPWWKNFIESIPGVQFLHRYIAYLAVLLTAIIWIKSRNIELTTLQRNMINLLIYVVFIQFLLGVLTLIYSVPVLLGVLHQTGAFILFASTLFLIHQHKVSQ